MHVSDIKSIIIRHECFAVYVNQINIVFSLSWISRRKQGYISIGYRNYYHNKKGSHLLKMYMICTVYIFACITEHILA